MDSRLLDCINECFKDDECTMYLTLKLAKQILKDFEFKRPREIGLND